MFEHDKMHNLRTRLIFLIKKRAYSECIADSCGKKLHNTNFNKQ